MTTCDRCGKQGKWVAYRTIRGHLRRRPLCRRHRLVVLRLLFA